MVVQRILYVEDNALVREITCELLARENRLIRACEDAEAAMQIFTQESFDLVITDVSLPVLSGIDLARAILELKPRTPIIVASGYALDFGLEQSGAHVRSIIKPFETGEIEALIAELAP